MCAPSLALHLTSSILHISIQTLWGTIIGRLSSCLNFRYTRLPRLAVRRWCSPSLEVLNTSSYRPPLGLFIVQRFALYYKPVSLPVKLCNPHCTILLQSHGCAGDRLVVAYCATPASPAALHSHPSQSLSDLFQTHLPRTVASPVLLHFRLSANPPKPRSPTPIHSRLPPTTAHQSAQAPTHVGKGR